MDARPFSSTHFFVSKRVPRLASFQQYTVAPFLTSGLSPSAFALRRVCAEGPGGALSVAAGCVVGGVAGVEASVGCSEWAGAEMASTVPIKPSQNILEDCMNFLDLPFDQVTYRYPGMT